MINVIVVTTGKRPELMRQTLGSMAENSAGWHEHHATLVVDGARDPRNDVVFPDSFDAIIKTSASVGASAARNIGASSIPVYRRGSHVCFFDDDVYCCPGWDETLLSLSRSLPGAMVSGHGHPFNHGEPGGDPDAALCAIPPHTKPLVISTVNFFMPWAMWDSVGHFAEPGGPGGSEDYDWCMRASRLGYGFAVSEPQCVIHCGLTSSSGKQIVGYSEMAAQNERLIENYGLQGKVIWK